MDVFPLIYIKNRKLLGSVEGKTLSINELPESSDGETVYVKDFDGIAKDTPNLNLYQKLSDKYELWVDAGPRTFGDVVDIIMAGANRITIMGNLFPMKDILNIKDVTDSMIYANVNLEREPDLAFTLPPGVDGLVVFNDKNQIESDFKADELLKTICSKYKVYAAGVDENNISYWKNMGVVGILLNLERFKLVNKDDFRS